jgi:uncharacterized Fe-S radical SAM superfamily protein PflX
VSKIQFFLKSDQTADTSYDINMHFLLCARRLMEQCSVCGKKCGVRNNWQSKHLALYETSTGSRISRPLRELNKKCDISPFKKEMFKNKL